MKFLIFGNITQHYNFFFLIFYKIKKITNIKLYFIIFILLNKTLFNNKLKICDPGKYIINFTVQFKYSFFFGEAINQLSSYHSLREMYENSFQE